MIDIAKWHRRLHQHDVLRLMLAVLIFLAGVLSVATFRAVGTARDATRTADAAVHEARRAQDNLSDYQSVGCERGRLQRAYLVIAAGQYYRNPKVRQQQALDLFPVVDCSEPARSTPLPPSQANAYLESIAKQMGIPTGWKAQ